MKINFPVICAALTLTVFFYSCGKDDTTTPTTDAREAFLGDWTSTEHSKQFGNTAYTISISKSSSDNTSVLIKNFYNLGASTTTIAKVSGTSITVSTQQVSSQTIHGSGSLSSGKINWTYYSDDGVQKDTCTAVSSK